MVIKSVFFVWHPGPCTNLNTTCNKESYTLHKAVSREWEECVWEAVSNARPSIVDRNLRPCDDSVLFCGSDKTLKNAMKPDCESRLFGRH